MQGWQEQHVAGGLLREHRCYSGVCTGTHTKEVAECSGASPEECQLCGASNLPDASSRTNNQNRQCKKVVLSW